MSKMSKILGAVLVLAVMSSAQLLNLGNASVVKVGDVEITQGKVDSLSQMLIATQFRGQQLPPKALLQVRMTVVDNLIGQELLKMEAKKLNIKTSAKEVDSLVKIFKAQFPDEQTFSEELRKTGSSEVKFRQKIKDQLASDKILSSKVAYPKPATEAEMKKLFNEAKAKGQVPVNDTVSGVQIILKLDPNESAKSIQDKKQMLQGFAAQVRAQKADFAMLAAQYSDDPNAKKTGGATGRFVAKNFGPEFEKVVKSMTVGEVSDVFQTKLGLHIFGLMEKNDGKFESYTAILAMNLQMKKEQERQMKIKEYLETLAKNYKIVVLNPEYSTSIGN